MAFKMERVKRTGTQKRVTKLKVKRRGQGKKEIIIFMELVVFLAVLQVFNIYDFESHAVLLLFGNFKTEFNLLSY